MKIGFITGAYLPAPGGVTTSVVNFSRQLRKSGEQVFIFCPAYPDKQPQNEEDVYRITSYYSPLLKDFRLTDPLRAARTFRRIFPSLDIVHVHLPTVMGPAARWISSHNNIPFFSTYHTNIERYIRHYIPGVPDYLARTATRLYASRETKNARKVFVPSSDMKQLLVSYNVGSPIEVLPTGIDLATYESPSQKGRSLKDQFGISEEESILLYVGRVGSEKNVGFLLDAFSEISKNLSSVHFVIVGGGRGLGEILAKVSKMENSQRIHFTGYVEDEEVLANYYREADLFLFSSLTETQGLVVAESLAAGTPVVAVDAPGVRDVLRGEKAGYLVPEDVRAFSEKILLLMNDPGLLESKAREAHRVAQRFSAETMTKKLLHCYRKSLEQ